jgi:hypothetical protein
MRVVRVSFALAAVLAAGACAAADPTAPAAPASPQAVHRNEGFLGSGNNVTNPAPPDTITAASGTSPH